MANRKHLAILDKGIQHWNAWRKENSAKKPDLSGAVLIDKDLRSINFSDTLLNRAELHNAILNNANLSGASLFETDLTGAKLIAADVSGAHLHLADLAGARLCKSSFHAADLGGANLFKADLHQTNFYRANLTEAIVSEAYLPRANLANAELFKTDFRGANLSRGNLIETNLFRANLGGANLARAELCRANLSEANLESANFEEADLSEAKLSEAYLYRANLCGANLQYADLRGTCLIGADIRGADLRECTLVDTNLEYADLSGSSVFGVSAWRLNLKETTQKNLVISQYNEPEVKVDSLEIAQLLYWLLYNENIYTIIDKITSKLVIISGHFIAERKPIFKVLQSELHQHGLTPILLDFEETAEKVANTTIHTLANIARFVIADITNPRTIPGSMLSFIEGLPSIPVQPIKNRASDLWLAYERIQKKSWVLPLYQYQDVDDLLTNFTKEIIEPAEQKMLILQAAAGSAHSKRSK